MLRGLTFKTRARLAAVFAVLGLLVWADARTQECTAYGQSPGAAALPGELADHGVICTAR
jgi:hypothetical protein